VTSIALYLGLRAYSFDSRLWVRVAWIVYALCVEGSSVIVWLNLVALDVKAHERDLFGLLLILLWGVPPLLVMIFTDPSRSAAPRPPSQ